MSVYGISEFFWISIIGAGWRLLGIGNFEIPSFGLLIRDRLLTDILVFCEEVCKLLCH